ncbi:hypothetical protein CC86DRAFT_462761 [Ophiobolus disseminans]|uniref:DUF6594 domain-containing protein n=1 Tax=Ophiobolus disseminans TaxID=1469910 RepID=A0A6A7AIE7_9PLEO|nr:hypothetical protein CC86DRAFT_462761 [Ophiobolus disseminans]
MTTNDKNKKNRSTKDEEQDAAQKSHNPLFDLVLGYPRMAGRMALKPQTAAFRRFSALNARMLLYMQADLCRLEVELMKEEKFDSDNPTEEKNRYATNYNWLRVSAANERPPRQLQLIKEIKEKLREYNEFLLQISHVHALKEPDRFDLRDFQHFMGNEELMGVWALTDHDRDVWGSAIEPEATSIDLVGIQTRHKEDSFSKWVAEHAIYLLRCGLARVKRPDKRTGMVGYYESSVLKITFGLTSILASLIPIASIIVLVVLSPRPIDKAFRAQIATIAAFNVLISVCLTIFTDAKRTDVFAVTAAFTAVQVVFLGIDNDWKPK